MMFKLLKSDRIPGPSPARLRALDRPYEGYCSHCGGPVPADEAWRGVVGIAGQTASAALLCQDCALELSKWLYGRLGR